mgnify:FL=1
MCFAMGGTEGQSNLLIPSKNRTDTVNAIRTGDPNARIGGGPIGNMLERTRRTNEALRMLDRGY